jgi:hypothetical protein
MHLETEGTEYSLCHGTRNICDSPPAILEFLPEGPGTGFLHKKRVPGGLLSAPIHSRFAANVAGDGRSLICLP